MRIDWHGDTPPPNPEVGDTWNGLHIWNGTEWVTDADQLIRRALS
jgi:hypothetical protein